MPKLMHFTNVKWFQYKNGPEEFYYDDYSHPNDIGRAIQRLEEMENDQIVSFHVKLHKVITANKEE